MVTIGKLARFIGGLRHKLRYYDILAIPVVGVIRLLHPWFLVRFGDLIASRVGHFAGNTELYLCERDADINQPKQRHVDIFCMLAPVSNKQLATMWKRVIPHIWPSWLLASVRRLNQAMPGYELYVVGKNTQHDRDVHNLLDRFPPHLQFTDEEEARGKAGLRELGIPEGAPYVCLMVRDSAYLTSHQLPGHQKADFSYHDYRDCDIQNFVLAAEELAGRGYFVVRMGAKVHEAINTPHPRVIDYATNGMRTDFMDVYLGAKCTFCLTSGTGWDSIAWSTFRRPVVVTNCVPIGYSVTFSSKFLLTAKRLISSDQRRELSLREISAQGIGAELNGNADKLKNIQFVENTPEEIRDVAIEMTERLNGTWREHEGDEALQKRFWELFPTDAVSIANGGALHGQIRARFGASFLRANRDWLQ